jgi:hypothetical protein
MLYISHSSPPILNHHQRFLNILLQSPPIYSRTSRTIPQLFIMRFSTTAAILVLATSVAANNCKKGLNYCGWNLIKIGSSPMISAAYLCLSKNTHLHKKIILTYICAGNYKDTIIAELNRVGRTPDPNHIYNDLYYCKDDGGWINYSKECHGENSCQDGGQNSDYC